MATVRPDKDRMVPDELLVHWLTEASENSTEAIARRLKVPDLHRRKQLATDLYWAARWLDYSDAPLTDIQEEPTIALKLAKQLNSKLDYELLRIMVLTKNTASPKSPLKEEEQRAIELFDKLRDNLKEAIECMESFDFRSGQINPWHVCAGAIAFAVRGAWFDTCGEDPKSPNDSHPLNIFVQFALCWFEGFARPAETIATVLKRRYGQPHPFEQIATGFLKR